MKATYEWAQMALKRIPERDSVTVEVFTAENGSHFGYDKHDHHLAYILDKQGKFHALCECMIRGMEKTGGIIWELLSPELAQDIKRRLGV